MSDYKLIIPLNTVISLPRSFGSTVISLPRSFGSTVISLPRSFGSTVISLPRSFGSTVISLPRSFGSWIYIYLRDRRGRDSIVDGFTTAHVISAYHY